MAAEIPPHLAYSHPAQVLVDIDLCGNQITSQGIEKLAAGIKDSPSLADVALDNNDLREEGGHALLEAVKGNVGLVRVSERRGSLTREMHTFFGDNFVPSLSA